MATFKTTHHCHGHLPESRTRAETDHRTGIPLHTSMVVTVTLKKEKGGSAMIPSHPLPINQLPQVVSTCFDPQNALLHKILINKES